MSYSKKIKSELGVTIEIDQDELKKDQNLTMVSDTTALPQQMVVELLNQETQEFRATPSGASLVSSKSNYHIDENVMLNLNVDELKSILKQTANKEDKKVLKKLIKKKKKM